MKSERGITLTALVLYIAVATLVISCMALLSAHFFTTTDKLKEQSNYVVEYNKFNMFFINDLKSNKTATVTSTTITFENNVKYEYKENKIYRNDVEIAQNVKNAEFTTDTYVVENTTKNIIKVNLTIGTENKEYKKEIEYVLRYW